MYRITPVRKMLTYNALLDTKGTAERTARIVLERIQSTNARAINYHYKRMFVSLRNDILDLDDIPDMIDLTAIVMNYNNLQRNILTDAYSRMADSVLPMVSDTDLLKSSVRSICRKADDTVDTELYKLRIMDYINTQVGIHITRIDNTTLKNIQLIMARTSTTQEFQDAIKVYFRNDAPNRAYTIARTESHNAAMTSADTSVRVTQSNRQKSKTWTVTHANTRSTHMAMDGVSVNMDELFRVPRKDGGTDLMMYPGDSSHGAGAGNIVNCHCYLKYRYID